MPEPSAAPQSPLTIADLVDLAPPLSEAVRARLAKLLSAGKS